MISHAFCLGMPDATVVDTLIAALAEARIAIMTTASASRPVPPLKRLVQAGVVVCAGSDGIHDTWGPYGNADMLERAMFVGQRHNLRRDDELALALDVVTVGGARALGLEGYGLAPGCGGDLVLVEAETIAEAVAQKALRDSWFDAPDLPTQKKICEDMQSYAFEQVPFIPIGQWFYPTAFRNTVTDIVRSPNILHWNLKKS